MAPKTGATIFVFFSLYHVCFSMSTMSPESKIQCRNRLAYDMPVEYVTVGQNFTMRFSLAMLLLQDQILVWRRGGGTRLGCIGDNCRQAHDKCQRYDFTLTATKEVIMSISNVQNSDKGKYHLDFYADNSKEIICELLSVTLKVQSHPVSSESSTHPMKTVTVVTTNQTKYTLTTGNNKRTFFSTKGTGNSQVSTKNNTPVTENTLYYTVGRSSLRDYDYGNNQVTVTIIGVPVISAIALVISIATCSFVCGCVHFRHHIKYQYRRLIDYRRSLYDYVDNSTQDIPHVSHAGRTNASSHQVSRRPLPLPDALLEHGNPSPPLPPRDHDKSIGTFLRGLRAPRNRPKSNTGVGNSGQNNVETEYAYAQCTDDRDVIRLDLVYQVVADENYEDAIQFSNRPVSPESKISEVSESTGQSILSDSDCYEEPIRKPSTDIKTFTLGTGLATSSRASLTSESDGGYNTLKCEVFGTSLNCDFDRLYRPDLERGFSSIRRISEEEPENYTICSSKKEPRHSSSDMYELMIPQS